jgi:2-polyprenyl-3-methyl-5-hydroxy-6-metoxy-1,4-benzoquinol methylase
VKNLPSKLDVKKAINSASNKFVKEYLREKHSYKIYFSSKFNDLRKYVNDGLLLDIGCGPGVFLKIAQNNGWKVKGVDLSKEVVMTCKRFAIDVVFGTISSSKLNNKKYDVITAFQLIEHVQNPLLFLHQMNKKLGKGGVIMLTTPDRKGFVAQILQSHWFEYYNEEHLFFFTKNSLKSIVEKSGFEIVTIKTEHGRSLNLPYIWSRLTDYYYTSASRMNSLLNRIGFFPRFVRNKLTIREPWVNIYLIAKKI